MTRWIWPALVAVLAVAMHTFPARADDRSTELFRYECASELGRRDVTLFANGTVRLRQSGQDEPTLDLAELGHDELASWLALFERDASRDDATEPGWARSVGGAWVERCSIVLALPERPEERYELTELDAPPLRVAQLVHVAEQLARRARPERAPRQLPDDYQPVRGHVLENAQGQRFRVKGFTGDFMGVELEGVDQPVTVFVSRENLLRYFFAVAESDPR